MHVTVACKPISVCNLRLQLRLQIGCTVTMASETARKTQQPQAFQKGRKPTSRKRAAATIEALETWKSLACVLAVLLLLCIVVRHLHSSESHGTHFSAAERQLMIVCQALCLDNINKRAAERQQPSDKQDIKSTHEQVCFTRSSFTRSCMVYYVALQHFMQNNSIAALLQNVLQCQPV